MAIPDYQSLMLPVLKMASEGEVKISEVIAELADALELADEERSELLPSGRQTTFSNRVHWAKGYLKQAGLLEATRRGHFRITERGREALAQCPTKIDVKYLMQFPEFVEFRSRQREPGVPNVNDTLTGSGAGIADSETPDELIRTAHQELNAALGEELLDNVIAGRAEFFERLIVTLLTEMGYGGAAEAAGRAIGRAGDGGVDGVIDQDPLGLDRVYVQAKRYARDNKIGPGAIREFFGSLDMVKASKGVFVTTSSFSQSAIDTASMLGKRIVLIDGEHMAKLMVRYNVGCRIEETVLLKRLDESFFENSQ